MTQSSHYSSGDRHDASTGRPDRLPPQSGPAAPGWKAPATVAAVVLSLALAVSPLHASGIAAAATDGSCEVFAYCPVDYPGDPTGYESLKKNADRIDTAAAFVYGIDPGGRPYGVDDERLFALQKEAGFDLVAVIHNFSNGTFDPEVVRPSLQTLDGRSRAAAAITSLVLSKGYSGVNIDFEGLTPDLRGPFSLFIKNLAGRLHGYGRTLTVAVPAKTWDNPSDAWSGAFDYRALAAEADRLVIMAYDEHWVSGPPGPIASIGWVERVAAYAAGAVPPEKVLLGVAQYAYDWPEAGGRARYIPTPEALRLAAETGATILWDGTAQVPHFYYRRNGAGRHVYIENSYSLAFKLRVVRQKGLAGIALWRLGYEDPLAWDMF